MLQNIIAFIIVVIIAVVLESYRESRIFKMTNYKLETTKLNADASRIKIIFLSDLHNHVYKKKNQSLLLALKNENPDYILIGGDMLIGKHRVKMDAAIDFCSKLPEIAPVYYSLGNHERRMKENENKYGTVIYDYINRLKSSGIMFLENETAEVNFNSFTFYITGLDLPIASYKKPLFKQIDGNYIRSHVGNANKKYFQILLAHNPELFEAYKDWGADLVLSGHLHGGVARIPGWRGIITPKLKLFPKYSGEMTMEDGHTIIVSKGLGTHTIHFRIFNYPEVVILELYGKTGE